MKRGSIFAGLLALALILGSASTWEGSAIVGGAGDFPDNGLYGACNSFPHNTSVVVTNLETGSTVTVIITQNVDNPGVFIALSPKAAAQLGMQVGAAARVRAVASIESPEASLPATRTGETSDPDFNPRVFMERDSAAQAAAAGKTPSTQSSSTQPGGAQTSSPNAAQLIEEAAASTEAGPNSAQAAASPQPVATQPPAPAATAQPPATVSPQPAAPAPLVAAATGQGTEPELEGGSVPQPRSSAPIHVALAEPAVQQGAATSASAPAPAPESASVIDLERPAAPEAGGAVALLEPELGPETLPEETLPRLAAPGGAQPDGHLAEIDLSTLKVTDNRPESIALERPQAAASAPEAPSGALGEPQSPTPEAFAKAGVAPAAAPGTGAASLQEPSAAAPSAGPSAVAGKPGEVVVGLEPAAPRPPAGGAPGAAAQPSGKPAAAVVAVKPVAPASAIPIQGLTKGSFYVQIGVYGTNDAVQTAVRGFAAYPLAVEKIEGKNGSVLYRLYVGPLSRDESGVVLLRIRSLGFKDAFLRTGT